MDILSTSSYLFAMKNTGFTHIRHWVFDLDHTLYPNSMRLFDQIEAKMTDYICRLTGMSEDDAHVIRHDYWRKYGTTLAGLMRHHSVDPHGYLEEVHDISFDILAPDPVLAAGISALPGRKIVYTNGSAPYAAKVLKARGLDGLFDDVYGVEHADFIPKPEANAFAKVFKADGLDTTKAAMFEDDPRNLKVPFDLGMRTIHVAETPFVADHIDHHTADLTGFVSALI